MKPDHEPLEEEPRCTGCRYLLKAKGRRYKCQHPDAPDNAIIDTDAVTPEWCPDA